MGLDSYERRIEYLLLQYKIVADKIDENVQ